MQTVKRYSLIRTKYENQCATLARSSKKILNLEIEGTVLEAQFKLGSGCLLIWLTDDSPYDEGLHVYLIDENDNIVDALEASADFTPGILKIVNTGEDWIEFKFFSNDSIYRLEVLKKVSIRMLLPAGWKYKKFFNLHNFIVKNVRTGKVQ